MEQTPEDRREDEQQSGQEWTGMEPETADTSTEDDGTIPPEMFEKIKQSRTEILRKKVHQLHIAAKIISDSYKDMPGAKELRAQIMDDEWDAKQELNDTLAEDTPSKLPEDRREHIMETLSQKMGGQRILDIIDAILDGRPEAEIKARLYDCYDADDEVIRQRVDEMYETAVALLEGKE